MKTGVPLSAVFRRTFSAFSQDKASRSAAALAYYTIFSIVPITLIVIAAAGLVLGREAARAEILGQLTSVLGSATATAIQEMIKSASEPKAGTIASVVGLATFLFGAAGMYNELRGALNTIWKVRRKKIESPIDFLRKHLVSMSVVFGVGFLVIASLIFDTGIATAGRYSSGHFRGGATFWGALQLIFSIVLTTILFAITFRFLPDAKVEWRDVTAGACVSSLLFVLGKFILTLYLSKAAVGSSFGAAGSIIVVLVWVYWSAHIFLFGVEFTHVYATLDGSSRTPMRRGSDLAPNSKPDALSSD